MYILLSTIMYTLFALASCDFQIHADNSERYVAIGRIGEAKGDGTDELKIVAVGTCVVKIMEQNQTEKDNDSTWLARGSIQVTNDFKGKAKSPADVVKMMRKGDEFSVYFALDNNLNRGFSLNDFRNTWILASSAVAGDSTTVEFESMLKVEERYALEEEFATSSPIGKIRSLTWSPKTREICIIF